MAPDILPNTDISFELELMWVGIPVAMGETGMLAPAAAELERLRLVREERQGMQHRREAEKRASEAAKLSAVPKKATAGSATSSPQPVETTAVDSTVDKVTAKKMNPKQLKAELKQRGLDVQGNKKELLARLLEAL